MPQPLRVATRQHPIVKHFRQLARRRAGDREVLLDGVHAIDEALRAGVPLAAVLVDARHTALATRAREAGVQVFEGSASILDAASPVRTPSGAVAIARWSPATIARAFDADPPLLLGLLDVQDPGNVGSAIRAADALEAGAVLALDSTADPGGWKAIRGAMGSTFRLTVARGTSAEALAIAHERRWRVAAAAAGQPTTIDRLDLTGPWLVLLGNEGAGLPDEIRRRADAIASIPMRAGVDSLNVAVSAALIAAEARRQRKSTAQRSSVQV